MSALTTAAANTIGEISLIARLLELVRSVRLPKNSANNDAWTYGARGL